MNLNSLTMLTLVKAFFRYQINMFFPGACKVRNEIETKRNRVKRSEIKRNETKRIFSKTKCNEKNMKNSIWHED